MLSGADVEDSGAEVPVEMIVDVNVVGIYVEGVVSGAAELLWLGDAVWVSGFTEVGCSVAIGVVDAEVSGAEVDGASVEVGFGTSVVASYEPDVTGSNVVIGTAVIGVV